MFYVLFFDLDLCPGAPGSVYPLTGRIQLVRTDLNIICFLLFKFFDRLFQRGCPPG